MFCQPYLQVVPGMRVIFTHSADCFEFTSAATVFEGRREAVGKGQLGQVVGVVRLPRPAVHNFLNGQGLAGAGGIARYGVHRLAVEGAEPSFVVWPVVCIADKAGRVSRVVVPHITVRESRWLEGEKAMAAVAFVPLHLGYAVNGQQLQGMTLRDPSLYLVADVTEAYWLQGLGAVMCTRTTDLARLLFRVPRYVWARRKANWFKVEQRVLDWLQRCRQTGMASTGGDVSWQQRRQRVTEKLLTLEHCTLDTLAGSAEELSGRQGLRRWAVWQLLVVLDVSAWSQGSKELIGV